MLDEKVPLGRCYVDRIAVEEDFRGKGIGKVLLEQAEKEARSRHCDVSSKTVNKIFR